MSPPVAHATATRPWPLNTWVSFVPGRPRAQMYVAPLAGFMYTTGVMQTPAVQHCPPPFRRPPALLAGLMPRVSLLGVRANRIRVCGRQLPGRSTVRAISCHALASRDPLVTGPGTRAGRFCRPRAGWPTRGAARGTWHVGTSKCALRHSCSAVWARRASACAPSSLRSTQARARVASLHTKHTCCAHRGESRSSSVLQLRSPAGVLTAGQGTFRLRSRGCAR